MHFERLAVLIGHLRPQTLGKRKQAGYDKDRITYERFHAESIAGPGSFHARPNMISYA